MSEIVHLSPRELQVAALYAAGNTVSQISVQLDLKPNTVESLVRDVRRHYLDAERPAPSKGELLSQLMRDGHIPRERI